MIYKDGTITLVSGSAIAKGTGTKFKANINGVSPGATIQFQVGATVYNNSVLSVNSDTEIVLAFPAPIAGNNVNYAILTTMTESYGDGVRKMMADVTYITYFLRNMDAWMTDNGIVELDMPNGQKVTLNSIHKMQEDIDNAAKIGLSVNNAMGVKDFAMGDDKGQVTVELADGKKVTLHSIQRMMEDIGKKFDKTGGVVDGGIRLLKGNALRVNSPNDSQDSYMLTTDDGETTIGNATSAIRFSGGKITFSRRELEFKDNLKDGAYREVTNHASLVGATRQLAFQDYADYRVIIGWANIQNFPLGISAGIARGEQIEKPSLSTVSLISIRGWVDDSGISSCSQLFVTPDGNFGIRYPKYNQGDKLHYLTTVDVWGANNTITDTNGFIKKSSPIINIYPDGTYTTNDESEGAIVARCDTGHYHINGIRGYNADGAWGVNGGISAPKDNNGLELIYIDDRVNEDGSIIIETFHRQHSHLPTRFQNWRLKAITEQGERVFYHEGEPCDLPEGTRLDVRVEMPESSVWNVKQKEIEEQAAKRAAEERIKAEKAEVEKGEFGLSENDVLL